jgi:hypothetical protein
MPISWNYPTVNHAEEAAMDALPKLLSGDIQQHKNDLVKDATCIVAYGAGIGFPADGIILSQPKKSSRHGAEDGGDEETDVENTAPDDGGDTACHSHPAHRRPSRTSGQCPCPHRRPPQGGGQRGLEEYRQPGTPLPAVYPGLCPVPPSCRLGGTGTCSGSPVGQADQQQLVQLSPVGESH